MSKRFRTCSDFISRGTACSGVCLHFAWTDQFRLISHAVRDKSANEQSFHGQAAISFQQLQKTHKKVVTVDRR